MLGWAWLVSISSVDCVGGLTRFECLIRVSGPRIKTTVENVELPRTRIKSGPRTREPAGKNLNPPRTPSGLKPRGPDPNPPYYCQAYTQESGMFSFLMKKSKLKKIGEELIAVRFSLYLRLPVTCWLSS